MKSVQRAGALAALALLSSFGPGIAFSQTSTAARQPTQSTTVVLAVDLRELTSLRDLPQSGDVFLNRVDRRQRRANEEYDLAIRYSVGASWKSVFGGPDDNRAPHVLVVEPGTYVVEKINIGSNATTMGPGIGADSHTPRFGSFVVREGEVLNLGRLVVHMHWHEGYFDANVQDNTDEARNVLADSKQGLARLQTRLLSVVPKLPFELGPGPLGR